MISITDIIIMLLMVIYAWGGSFLWHELMHIKSQGIKNTGRIFVHPSGMTVATDNKRWPYLCRLAGGLYSGIIHLIVGGFAWYYGIWAFYVPLITLGMINVIYGVYEAEVGTKGRYKIYGITTIIMIIFWIIYTSLYVI